MVGGVIHHQHHSSSRVLGDQQVFQEADELRDVLSFGNGPGDSLVDPIVATKYMPFLFDPKSGRGIHLYFLSFIQKALSSGSSVSVVSSTKMRLKSPPKTFFSALLAARLLAAWLLGSADGPGQASGVNIVTLPA